MRPMIPWLETQDQRLIEAATRGAYLGDNLIDDGIAVEVVDQMLAGRLLHHINNCPKCRAQAKRNH